jgi:peroxidase
MTNIESAKNLPSPFDPLDKLQEKFRNFNLDNTDLVALQGNVDYLYLLKQSCTVQISDLYNYLCYGLHTDFNDKLFLYISGAHTFGKVQCQFTQQNCAAGQPEDTLENLDRVTPNVFDNKYYGNLLHGAAQLPSDQVMLSLSDPTAEATTAPIVHRFAGNQKISSGTLPHPWLRWAT